MENNTQDNKTISRKSMKSIKISDLKIVNIDYVESINAINREKYGSICKQCDLYQYFCRCEHLINFQ